VKPDAALVKKADLAVKVARKMLGPKASKAIIEDQAVDLMALAELSLVETFNRLNERAR
jgi:hypothetical protein